MTAPEPEGLRAAVEALHGGLHWCFSADQQPEVYEPGSRFWPCPTMTALLAASEADRATAGEREVCDTCAGAGEVLSMIPGFTGEPIEGMVACPDCVSRVTTTSNPTNSVGPTGGEKDGKQGGVHPDSAREDAEGPDRAGLPGGPGVLDRSGPDPQVGDAVRPGRVNEVAPGATPGANPATPPADDASTHLLEQFSSTSEHDEPVVTTLLHTFDRQSGMCRCGAGPFASREWVAHYKAQDEPTRTEGGSR